ncbi:sodium-dependent transporter [Actinomyces howellii]|uniref:Na+-dependent transporters of the SNF family n=1 Tax=Actinomyces howellii TaxID=52771 RepID=A0A448HCY9_9ACTO|nr:sodium-dependent transporter [Actinomyces howellii]VEG25672.1 Na+-dependent transporters of the SNF family [Actinomyces howellii]
MSATQAPPAPEREQWSSQIGFLIAAIGSAIGLGNIWRFPGVAYTNGGGAFIVPYVVALLCAGIPVLFLDYAIGHRYRGSAPAAFRRLSRPFEVLGWWQVFICFIIMSYYAVVVAWAVRYMVFSVNTAWGKDATAFFNSYIGLGEISDAGVPAESFTPVAGVIVPLLLVWAWGIVTIALGVSKGVEKANKVFLPLLVLMFMALVVRALMLPGAVDGLNALFTPQWSALSDYKVWMAAFGQIFFSLSVGFGIMLTYSSYLKRRSNLVGTGFVAAFANSSFEILAGIGVFATLGFMAHSQSVAVSDLEGITGVGLSFMTFPTVISQMPGGPLFGVLFFASFSMAGLTSFISIMQVVAAGVGEKLNVSTVHAVLITALPAAVLSLLLFGTSSGLYRLDVVDAYINNIGVVGSAIVMCVGVAYVLRATGLLSRHLNAVSETRVVGAWWKVLVAVVVPVVLGYMFVQTAWSYATDGYGYAKSFEAVFGWGMLFLGAVVSAVMALSPWSSPVDDFQPVELEGLGASGKGVS